MGLPTTRSSASFAVGGLIVYGATEYRGAGSHLSGATVAWLNLGVIDIVISLIVHLRTRRPDETSDEAIQRPALSAAAKLSSS